MVKTGRLPVVLHKEKFFIRTKRVQETGSVSFFRLTGKSRFIGTETTSIFSGKQLKNYEQPVPLVPR